jgi:superoxide reductase
MKENTRFYICPICGNVIGLIDGHINHINCCGKPMQLLEANTTDAAQEKHVPAVRVEGNEVIVRIGSVDHPMVEEHFIQFVIVETENGFQVKYLEPNNEPEARFVVNEKVVAVYEYCNLHGLWKKEL